MAVWLHAAMSILSKAALADAPLFTWLACFPKMGNIPHLFVNRQW
jgi:hypothetical protein